MDTCSELYTKFINTLFLILKKQKFMKTQNIFILFLSLLFFEMIMIEIAKGQTNWPMSPTNQQQNITSTYGEFRNTCRFHQGIDITGNTIVRAINSGNIIFHYNNLNCWDSYVTINGVKYLHIKKYDGSGYSIIDGQFINTGDIIGEMFTYPNCALHIHLQESGTNFLNSNISPFVDNAPPTIHNYHFRKHRENNQLNTKYHNNSDYNQNVIVNSIPHKIPAEMLTQKLVLHILLLMILETMLTTVLMEYVII